MKKFLSCIGVLSALFSSLWALGLPAIFSNNLVLQSGDNTPVFGTASPNAKIEVVFKTQKGALKASAVADADGKWIARLPALEAGLAGELEVSGDGESQTFANAITGEIWLCSGQSNMEYTIGARTMPQENKQLAAKEAEDAAGAIRMFRVKNYGEDAPADDVVKENPAGWEIVTPQNVNRASAVAWNFAVRLHEETGRPVGILDTCWGGTPVEAWLPKETLDSLEVADSVWGLHERNLGDWEARLAEYQEAINDFLERYPTPQERFAYAKERPREPYHPKHHTVPVRLYNGMIHGLEPYGLAGFLWYQGETNAAVPRCFDYGEMIQALVKSWRKGFGKELPFYYVELANYQAPQSTPVQTNKGSWAYIREQQAKALELPKTGVACAIDVGEARDIHPTDKKTVGNRLANMALNDIYGKPSLCRSPEYKSHKIEGDTVVVSLNYADGLRARDDAIEGFAVCGDDGVWVWAEGTQILPDGKVAVRSEKVKSPIAARYAWASNPVISLENAAGLPLRPFRTDTDSEE